MTKICIAGCILCTLLLMSVAVSADDNLTALSGNITVSSSPLGATIFLDNTNMGIVTPNTLSNVLNGTHIVVLQLTGYDVWSTTVQVNGDNHSVNGTLTATATPTPTPTTNVTATPTTNVTSVINGSISFTSSPSNANVYIDSVLKGYTPLTVYNITPDSYTVRIQKSGYLIYAQRFNVTPGNTTTVSVTLTVEPTATPTISATAPPTTATTATPIRTSTAKTYTPWPTATPTQKSPLPLAISLAALGIGIAVLRKK